MTFEEINIKFGIEPKIIYSLCLLKDKKLAIGSHYILILNPEFSKILITIENKDNHPVYQIIQSKKGYLISAEEYLIKVYSIFDNYYNLISIYNNANKQEIYKNRIYKITELINGNIAYSLKYSKFLLFHSLNFKKISIKCELRNKEIINFIEMNKNTLILLCAKIHDKGVYFSQYEGYLYEYRLCYFYIKTLAKKKESSFLWELEDKISIKTEKNINSFVTRETMKIIEKNYLLIVIGDYLYIYQFDELANFELFTYLKLYTNFIQCLCPFTKDILALGTWSGEIIFIKIQDLLAKSKKTEQRLYLGYQKIRNLIQVKDGIMICIKDDDKRRISKNSLIKYILN